MESKIAEAYSTQNFLELSQVFIDLIATELQKSKYQPDERTLNWEHPDQQLAFWQKNFDEAVPANAETLFNDIISRSIDLHNKKSMGHQTPPTPPVTALTGALMAFLNNGMALYDVGMAGNAMEKVVISHMAKLLGFSSEASGLITSGGTLGNLTSLLAARQHFIRKNPDTPYNQLSVMVSEEAHYSISRALAVMGLPKENVISVPVEKDFTIRTPLLEEIYQQAREESKVVFAIIGCACTTVTGSYDNLSAIADFAQQHDLWFHVDAAHGGTAIFSEKYAGLLKGVERCDSVIIDFHKMMMVPALSTLIIFRSDEIASHTFAHDAEYFWQDKKNIEWYDSGKRTFECTKPMSIIHVYTLFRLYGNQLFRENVEILYELAKNFAKSLAESADFEVVNNPMANILCFRYLSVGTDLEQLNQHILKSIVQEGRFYIVSTRIKERFYLRTALMNPMSTMNEVNELMNSIRKIGVESSEQFRVIKNP